MAADPYSTYLVSEALRRRGRTRVRIEGHSMYPILRDGMQVIVEPVAYDELMVGDMVVFYDGRGLICHRLLKKRKSRDNQRGDRHCYLKGDTNTRADPPVSWTQVLGRVTHIIADGDKADRHPATLYGEIYLDIARHRRRAHLIARFSYLYACYYHILHAFGRCQW